VHATVKNANEIECCGTYFILNKLPRALKQEKKVQSRTMRAHYLRKRNYIFDAGLRRHANENHSHGFTYQPKYVSNLKTNGIRKYHLFSSLYNANAFTYDPSIDHITSLECEDSTKDDVIYKRWPIFTCYSKRFREAGPKIYFLSDVMNA